MCAFERLVSYIAKISKYNFKESISSIQEYIIKLSNDDFLVVIRNIGTIPENIEHDSSEEKLYSKASDIILAQCFQLLGLGAKALDERADSADIVAKSIHGYRYSLVADSKCFRLSRTAKNQKDFKVSNLSDWRGSDNEYAVLVAPFFQYPKTKSQIYSKALEHNVCLLSWEHVSILLENNIKETENFSLESIWNLSQMVARDSKLAYNSRQDSLIPKMNGRIAEKLGITLTEFENLLSPYKNYLVTRGKQEIIYWKNEIENIKSYTKEQAISKLIEARKLNEKINVISKNIKMFERDFSDE